MRNLSSCLACKAGLLGAAVLLAWAATHPSASSTPAQWRAAAAGPALFLQSGAPAAVQPGPAAGGSNRAHLPNSTIGTVTGAVMCSVDSTDPGAPPTCSTHTSPTTVGARCSARCDTGQVCSAFAVGGVNNSAECSTSGVPNGICSSLQPPGAAAAGSFCSVRVGIPNPPPKYQCSVLRAARNQRCSAQNPGTPANFCSVTGIGPVAQCSVLSVPPVATKSFCSVGGTGAKRCSVEAGSVGAQCSVAMGTNGTCTSFLGAPLGACSIQGGAASTCSIIGGPNGTLCNLP